MSSSREPWEKGYERFHRRRASSLEPPRPAKSKVNVTADDAQRSALLLTLRVFLTYSIT